MLCVCTDPWLPMAPQARLELLRTLEAAVPARAAGAHRIAKDYAVAALGKTHVKVQLALAGARVHLGQVGGWPPSPVTLRARWVGGCLGACALWGGFGGERLPSTAPAGQYENPA
jgi:hypothetical protein